MQLMQLGCDIAIYIIWTTGPCVQVGLYICEEWKYTSKII